jgi:hypothetical protein
MTEGKDMSLGKIILVWRGYFGEAQRGSAGGRYRGRVINAPDEVFFEGNNIEQVQIAFKQTVETLPTANPQTR